MTQSAHNALPIGHESIRLKRGIYYIFVRTAKGWKSKGRCEKLSPYTDKSKRNYLHRQGEDKEFKPMPRERFKAAVKRLPDKIVTEPQKLVRINSKTQILIPIHADEQAAIDKWLKRHTA